MGGQNDYPEFDKYAVNLIHFKARQLCRQPGFSQEDQADIEQELIIELWKRLSNYDPKKADIHAFVSWVIQQKIADLIETQLAQIRDPRKVSCSLNDVVTIDDGRSEERCATMDIEEYLQSTNTTRRNNEEQLALLIDLDKALNCLPNDLRRLCELLSEKSISEVARELNIARSTLYLSIKKIRKLLKNAGLKIYL